MLHFRSFTKNPAKMRSNPHLKDPSWWEYHFSPFFATSQEKWLAEAFAQKREKLLIITAHRGARKTMTAKRVCARFHPSKIWTEFTYVDYSNWWKYESMSPEAWDRTKRGFNAACKSVAALTCDGLCALGYGVWCNGPPSDVSGVVAVLTAALPTIPGMIIAVLSVVVPF